MKHHCVCLEAFLRLAWPFIVLQFALCFFLTQTGQGQDILRSETLSLLKTCTFLFFSAIFALLVWMLTRTVIEWTENNLKQMSGSAPEPRNSDQRRARQYRYNAPAVVGVLFLVLLGWWLTTDTGNYWYIAGFGIAAIVILRFLWPMRLGFAKYALYFFSGVAGPLFLLACFFPVTAADLVGRAGIYNIAFVGFLFLMVFAAVLVVLAHKYPITLLATTVVLFIIWLLPIDKQLEIVSDAIR